MKILRFRNVRTQEYARLQQSIKTLESAVAALASEAAATRSSIASVGENARALLRRLEELEQEENDAARPRRVLCLTALCVVLLLLAGGLTYTGVKGFANPRAVPSSGESSIVLAIRVPTPTATEQAGFPLTIGSAYVYTMFTQDTDQPVDPSPNPQDNAFYQIVVPAKYAGKQFVLMLTGTARINLRSGYGSFQSWFTACTGQQGYLPITEQCQFITGRFPSEPTTDLPGRADAYRCQERLPSGQVWPGNAVEIDLEGISHLSTASDWAYQQYSLPGTDNRDSDAYGYKDRLNGIPLGGWYEPASLSGCMLDQLPRNADLTDVYAPATQSNGNQLLWSGPDIGTNEFVVRRRNADEIGNALLAGGAAMAALAIGFIPVAYDAEWERRRGRKRRRARRRAHPA